MLLHLVVIAGDNGLIGAEAKRVLRLAGRSGEDDDVSSERMSKLHRHMAQSAETDHANILALGNAPVAMAKFPQGA